VWLPQLMIRDDVLSGRLEVLLPDYDLGNADLCGVYQSRSYLSSKVRTFLDFVSSDPRMKWARDRRSSYGIGGGVPECQAMAIKLFNCGRPRRWAAPCAATSSCSPTAYDRIAYSAYLRTVHDFA
jgi:hypothetical protein